MPTPTPARRPGPMEAARRALSGRTHHLRALPVLILMPHSRCNCRCVMCDIWRANQAGTSLSEAQIEGMLPDLERLGVRWVTLSGGEALMHPNLFRLCALLRRRPLKITLLSTGLLLPPHARDVVRWCDEVIVSLDGSPEVHDRIRGVPRAFERLREGVQALRALRQDYPVHARCVLSAHNAHDLPGILDAARALGLRSISFLPVDTSSEAFNRPGGVEQGQAEGLVPTAEQLARLRADLADVEARYARLFSSGFVRESPERLRRIADHLEAQRVGGAFPPVRCNAPWVSAVVEATGEVRPCFFHPPYGALGEEGLEGVLNSPGARAFRQNLKVEQDPTCQRCVCTLHVDAWTAL